MSRKATDAWRNLRDDVNLRGEPLVAGEPSELDDLWELLPTSVQQAVARGEATLEQVIERMLDPGSEEMCPFCGSGRVPTSGRAQALGMCAKCARERAIFALQEIRDDVALTREANMAKQQLHRARLAAGVPLPREKKEAHHEDAL